jgi:hypothetical protein
MARTIREGHDIGFGRFGVHTHGSIHVRRLVQNTNTPIKSLVINFDVN